MGKFDNRILTTSSNGNANMNLADDGIDTVSCKENCIYRDTVLNRCLFETCIAKTYPISIPMHQQFTHNCEICGEEYTIEDTNKLSIFTHSMQYKLCSKCQKKLKDLVRGDNNV